MPATAEYTCREIVPPVRVRRFRAAAMVLFALAAHLAAPDRAEAETEIWSATLTVGTTTILGVDRYGYSAISMYGSLSPATFSYRTATAGIRSLTYGDEAASRLVFSFNNSAGSVIPDDGLLGSGDFTLELGTGANKKSILIENPGDKVTFEFTDHGVSWSAGETVAVRLVRSNAAATGAPTISGAFRVGETLTADLGGIMDEGGLPTGAGDYTYEWLRVDSDGMSNETAVGTNSATYTVTAADMGKKIKVRVSFTDNQGKSESLTSEVYPAGAGTVSTACPADSNWCATLTVGYGSFGLVQRWGTVGDGTLSPASFAHGDTTYRVGGLNFTDSDGVRSVSINLGSGTHLPRGSVLDLGGTRFTAAAASESSGGGHQWDAPTGFAWTEGQQVTVSANLPPALESATVDEASLVLNYSESLDEASGGTPAASAFSVKVAGGAGVNPTDVEIDGPAVTLTLATPVKQGQAVTVSYTQPTNRRLRDTSGMAAPDLDDVTVTNETRDIVAPTLVSVQAGGNRVILSYDETLDRNSVPAASAFSVTANGGGRTVSGVSVDGEIVLLTLSSAVSSGQTVRVRYTKPAANPIQDLAGNDAADFDRSETAALFATLLAEDYSFDANSHMHYRFNLVLTEPVAIGFKHMRDRAFRVENGTMVRAKRLDKATRSGKVVASLWRLTVRAHTRSRPVTVSLPANRPCTRRGALCTLGGVRLANAPSLTLSTASVAGHVAPTLSIADASAPENAAALNFTITLSSPLRSAVEVHFETLDDDSDTTATAGTDYWATSQTILIPAGSRTLDMGVRLVEDMDDDRRRDGGGADLERAGDRARRQADRAARNHGRRGDGHDLRAADDHDQPPGRHHVDLGHGGG